MKRMLLRLFSRVQKLYGSLQKNELDIDDSSYAPDGTTIKKPGINRYAPLLKSCP